MKIAHQTLPTDSLVAAASEWLSGADDSRAFVAHLLRVASTKGVALSMWHRMFEVVVDDLLARKPLELAARDVGWRCLVSIGGPVVAAMEARRPEGDTWLAPTLTRDALAVGTEEGVRTAEQFPVDGDWTYELNFLAVPGLQVWALWMRAANAPDWFIPLGPSQMPAGTVLPSSKFMTVAYELAEQLAKQLRQDPDYC